MLWRTWSSKLGNWLRTAPRRIPRRVHRAKLAIESLESRRLLTANEVSITPASQPEGLAGLSDMLVSVNRTGNLQHQVAVRYQTSNGTAIAGSDYENSSGQLLFAEGVSSATITIPIMGDTDGEESEDFNVALLGSVQVIGPEISLGPQKHIASNGNARTVQLADLNGDGRPEAIVAHDVVGKISIFVNNTSPASPNLNYDTKQDLDVHTNPVALAVGDLNGDGRPDIVVANSNTGVVSVLMNATSPGASTLAFTALADFQVGVSALALVMTDANYDGRLDLAVADGTGQRVAVLLNTTITGSMTPTFSTQAISLSTSPTAIIAADINHDGLDDLVVASAASNSLSVLINGSFSGATAASYSSPFLFNVGTSPKMVVAGDFNLDGRLDLAVTNQGSDTFSVLINTTVVGATTPTFAAKQDTTTAASPSGLAVADMNGDGLPDLLVTSSTGNNAVAFTNHTWLGSTTAAFIATLESSVGATPVAVAVGDVNGDGSVDAVTANFTQGSISALLNVTTIPNDLPDYVQTSRSLTNIAGALATADFNRDGKFDVVTASASGLGLEMLVNSTVIGGATASFSVAGTTSLASAPRSVNAVDVNHDGLVDLVVSLASNQIAVLINQTAAGAATFTFNSVQTINTSSSFADVSSGDLNGDGRSDLVLTDPANNSVSVLLNATSLGSTTASFVTSGSLVAADQPLGVALADFNNDGLLDIVVTNHGAGAGTTVSVYINETAPGASIANFATKQDFTVDAAPSAVAVLDLNDDGRLDIVTANHGTDSTSVFYGDGNGNFLSSATYSTGYDSYPSSLAAGDFNTDTYLDIAVANYMVQAMFSYFLEIVTVLWRTK